MSIAASDVEPKTTEITQNFTFDDYVAQNPNAMLLFVTGTDGQLSFPLDEEKLQPGAGAKITALVPVGK